MDHYHYRGLTADGAPVDGVLEAQDPEDAAVRARAACSVVLGVERVRAAAVGSVLHTDMGELLRGGRFADKELSLLCSQLAIELRAGLPLVRALRLVADNTDNRRMKKLLEETAGDVQAGYTLADSMARHGPKLPPTFIETLRSGEESGRTDECFARLKTYYANSSRVHSKVVSALIYPVLLLIVAFGVIAIIMVKAVPVFEQSFASLGIALPLPTRMLIAFSGFMSRWGLALLALVAAAVLLWRHYSRTAEHGRQLRARTSLRFPGTGKVNQMSVASQFASTMATMLASGLPMVRALTITARVTDNYLVQQDLLRAAEGVTSGRHLGECLRESPWLPSLLLEMTAVGEETGNLEETLSVVSDYYSAEVETAVARALSLLEPIIIMLLAGFVVLILLSVYLPLFSMYGSI